jgi:hypothetical protein
MVEVADLAGGQDSGGNPAHNADRDVLTIDGVVPSFGANQGVFLLFPFHFDTVPISDSSAKRVVATGARDHVGRLEHEAVSFGGRLVERTDLCNQSQCI